MVVLMKEFGFTLVYVIISSEEKKNLYCLVCKKDM